MIFFSAHLSEILAVVFFFLVLGKFEILHCCLYFHTCLVNYQYRFNIFRLACIDVCGFFFLANTIIITTLIILLCFLGIVDRISEIFCVTNSDSYSKNIQQFIMHYMLKNSCTRKVWKSQQIFKYLYKPLLLKLKIFLVRFFD